MLVKVRVLETVFGTLFLPPENKDTRELIEDTIGLAIVAGQIMGLEGDVTKRAVQAIERESLMYVDSFGVSCYRLRMSVQDGKSFTQAFHDLLEEGLTCETD